MPTRNVNLTDHYDSFIEDSIAAGRFANASEAVRAGLNLLQRQDAEDKAKLQCLRTAIQSGIDQIERGEGIAFASVDELAAEIHAIGKEVSRELAAVSVRG
jgi:antitoxin ParD1/3/4